MPIQEIATEKFQGPHLGIRNSANLMEKNPSKRLSAKQALDHPWFNFVIARPDDEGYVDEGTVMRLLNYNGKSILKRAGLYMLCNTLGPDDVKDLRE